MKNSADNALTTKAIEQYYHDQAAFAAATGSPIAKPAYYSGVRVVDGVTYVQLVNIHGTMAPYKVSEPVNADSTVTFVDRDHWPQEFEEDEDEDPAFEMTRVVLKRFNGEIVRGEVDAWGMNLGVNDRFMVPIAGREIPAIVRAIDDEDGTVTVTADEC